MKHHYWATTMSSVKPTLILKTHWYSCTGNLTFILAKWYICTKGILPSHLIFFSLTGSKDLKSKLHGYSKTQKFKKDICKKVPFLNSGGMTHSNTGARCEFTKALILKPSSCIRKVNKKNKSQLLGQSTWSCYLPKLEDLDILNFSSQLKE